MNHLRSEIPRLGVWSILVKCLQGYTLRFHDVNRIGNMGRHEEVCLMIVMIVQWIGFRLIYE